MGKKIIIVGILIIILGVIVVVFFRMKSQQQAVVPNPPEPPVSSFPEAKNNIESTNNLDNGTNNFNNFDNKQSTACNDEVLQCADGSYVHRVPPDCNFANCQDKHGCVLDAGYQWCEEKQKCLRIWEESCPSLKP